MDARRRPPADTRRYPGGGREWDWSETGTRHQPGIQPADVEELLTHGATVVVLSQGMDEQLHAVAVACMWSVSGTRPTGCGVRCAPSRGTVKITGRA
jgi:hypothetical protein